MKQSKIKKKIHDEETEIKLIGGSRQEMKKVDISNNLSSRCCIMSLKKLQLLLLQSSVLPTPAPDSLLFTLAEEQVGQEAVPVAMAFEDTKEALLEPEGAIHLVRITLTSLEVKSLENIFADLVK